MRSKKTFSIFLAIAGIQFSLPLANAAVSPAPEVLFSVFGLPITNSIVTSWVIVILLIVGIRMMIGGRPQLIPGRGQAIIENLLVGLRDMIEPIVGKKALRKCVVDRSICVRQLSKHKSNLYDLN